MTEVVPFPNLWQLSRRRRMAQRLKALLKAQPFAVCLKAYPDTNRRYKIEDANRTDKSAA